MKIELQEKYIPKSLLLVWNNPAVDFTLLQTEDEFI